MTASHVMTEDISALVSFNNHTAVVWTNQSNPVSNTLHLALHPDTSGPTSGWKYYSATLPSGVHIDDHVDAKSIAASNDQLFVALKMDSTTPTDTAIGMYAMDTSGNITFHKYSEKQDGDTRPILIVDESTNEVHLFVTGKTGGSKICYKTLSIPPAGDFPAGDCGVTFIEDDVIKNFNNATSMKRNVNATTGIVVLAGDDANGKLYGHNVMGNPPPVVDVVEPARNALAVPLTSTVKASFSKDMKPGTLTPASFIVKGPGGQVAGQVTYNAASKTATFAPNLPLVPNTVYTVELTNAIQDSTNQSLNEGIEAGVVRETWQFTTTGPFVQFDNTGYTVNEGDVATIIVTLESPSSMPVMVDYTTAVIPPGELPPGTSAAVPGVDYTTAANTLTFPPNVTSQSFSVTTLNNAIIDGQKVFGVQLSNPVDSTLGEPNTAKVTIFDDETPTIRFQNAEYTVDEGAGTATIQVTLSPMSTSQVTVKFRTQDGTATAGKDYTAVTNQTLTFAPGVTSQPATVPIINDNLNELNETVTLILENPNPAGTVIANSPATLIILDNDPQPSVKFKSDKYTVDESAGKVTLNVELSTASGREVTVKYATGGGSATPGVDYKSANGTLTFAKGVLVQTVMVDLIDDNVPDSDETFNVGLSDPDGATLGVPTAAEVTITDTDFPGMYLPLILSE